MRIDALAKAPVHPISLSDMSTTESWTGRTSPTQTSPTTPTSSSTELHDWDPEEPVHESSSKRRLGQRRQVIGLDAASRPAESMIAARRSPVPESDSSIKLADARVMALRASRVEGEPAEAAMARQQQKPKPRTRGNKVLCCTTAVAAEPSALQATAPGPSALSLSPTGARSVRKQSSPLAVKAGMQALSLS